MDARLEHRLTIALGGESRFDGVEDFRIPQRFSTVIPDKLHSFSNIRVFTDVHDE